MCWRKGSPVGRNRHPQLVHYGGLLYQHPRNSPLLTRESTEGSFPAQVESTATAYVLERDYGRGQVVR